MHFPSVSKIYKIFGPPRAPKIWDFYRKKMTFNFYWEKIWKLDFYGRNLEKNGFLGRRHISNLGFWLKNRQYLNQNENIVWEIGYNKLYRTYKSSLTKLETFSLRDGISVPPCLWEENVKQMQRKKKISEIKWTWSKLTCREPIICDSNFGNDEFAFFLSLWDE